MRKYFSYHSRKLNALVDLYKKLVFTIDIVKVMVINSHIRYKSVFPQREIVIQI